MSLVPLSNIYELRRLLNKQNRTYLLNTVLPSSIVYLQFEGSLQGKTIVWNACIRTIKEFSMHYPVEKDPRQFIDIRYEDGAYYLQVGLNVRQIDQGVIERTIIMVRKYRKLRPGRHEYGRQSKTQ